MSDFRSSDGRSHESAGARDAHQAELNDQATFEKAVIGATWKGGGILAKIFLVAPLILSFVGSFIFGLLFFAGIVGRIIQSIIVGLICGFVMIFVGLTVHFPNALMVLSVIAASGLSALWYYFSHYFTMRVYSTDNGEFSDGFADALPAVVVLATAIVPPFAFLFYGGLVAYIVFSIAKSATIGIIIFVVAVVGAIAYYVFQSLKVRKDAEEAKKEDKDKRPRMVTFVCGIVAVAIACLLPFNEMVAQNKRDKEITAKYAAGKEIKVEDGNNKIYEHPDEKSTVIKVVNDTDVLISTGKVKFSSALRSKFIVETYILVEFDGIEGWVIRWDIPEKKVKEKPINTAQYAEGSILVINKNTDNGINIYEEAREGSKVVGQIKGGVKITSTGTVTNNFVSVDNNGTKGWVDVSHASPIIGTATVTASRRYFFFRDTLDERKSLEVGETFDVYNTDKDWAYGVYKDRLGYFSIKQVSIQKK